MKNRTILLPSIADVIFVILFISLSFRGAGLLGDGDTGYHIRAGEYMINTLSVPKNDIFSFLSPPLPWTAHEWLSEVIMALVHRVSGLTGIVLFFAFLISSVYFLLFKTIRSRNHDILAAAAVTILVTGSSTIHWLARPHVFSLLLTVIWYHLLDGFQYQGKNRLYLLPALMLLWVNLHGGFILGLMLTGVYLSGNILDGLFRADDERKKCVQRAKNLALCLAACLAASLVNPHGWRILLFPFEIASNKFIMDSINEFLSPNFHNVALFKYMILLVIAVFAISKASLNVIEIILVTLFTNMALYSARHIPLFGIIVLPVITRQMDLIIARGHGLAAGGLVERFFDIFRKKSEGIASMDGCARGYLWPAITVMAVIAFFAAGTGKAGGLAGKADWLTGGQEMEYKFDGKKLPVEAVEFMKRENIPGNMFNNDEFGDYIIYAAWPRYRVFFDGRSDMYGEAMLREYFKIIWIEPGWDGVLKKYDINWIIYNSGSALSQFLLQRRDWRLIYSDGVADIFVRDTAENRGLTEKYKDTKPVEGK
ncbi:MAG: hypothetical protein HY890_06295 [Deltaproteobacteria bacterium]|nr:hypothetical protein [Deltaproteobacteria bacterium]